MSIASHPVCFEEVGQPVSLSALMLVNTLYVELVREKSPDRLRIESNLKTAYKMLQRAASNVSDKAKSSKPKVGENMNTI